MYRRNENFARGKKPLPKSGAPFQQEGCQLVPILQEKIWFRMVFRLLGSYVFLISIMEGSSRQRRSLPASWTMQGAKAHSRKKSSSRSPGGISQMPKQTSIQKQTCKRVRALLLC
jgi:hypothetical protein